MENQEIEDKISCVNWCKIRQRQSIQSYHFIGLGLQAITLPLLKAAEVVVDTIYFQTVLKKINGFWA